MARTSLRPDDPAWIGSYRLMARLGSGGMGVVYLGAGYDGRLVAIKVLRPELADDPELRQRFSREVSALLRVQGVCTVRVIEADTESARPFMVTEYAEGPSLAEYISQHGSLGPDMLFGLATGLAEALTVIHGAGLVHRDLKPSNIILTSSGPKVIDFGIAQMMDAVSLTRTGMMVGSAGFMAPEQVFGRPGPGADVFVWGVTVAYAALGQSPFGTGNTDAMVYRVMHVTPDLAAVPDPLRPLVTAAMAKEPEQRPSAPQILSELTSISHRQPGASQDSPTQTILAQTWTTPEAGAAQAGGAPAGGSHTGGPQSGAGAHPPRPVRQTRPPREPAPVSQPTVGIAPAAGSLLLEPAETSQRSWRPRTRRARATAWIASITASVVAVAVVAIVLVDRPAGHTPGKSNTADQQAISLAATLPWYHGQEQRAVQQTIPRILAWNDTLVTTGAQTSDGVTRQQFFVSTDGGKHWKVAPVRTTSGGQPPLGLTANRIAAGPRGWVAIGGNSIWTSSNGQSWTLRAAHGLPSQSHDQILVANGTAGGFVAGGLDGDNKALIWTSSDGVSWQRTTAAQLGLVNASDVTPTNISLATSIGRDTLICDKTSVWLNTGGSGWTRVSIPADHGAQDKFGGLAADGSGLLAVRPRDAGGGVAYFSPNGQTWQYAGTITSSSGWSPNLVKGSNYGFAVADTGEGQVVVYSSTGKGGSWRPTPSMGSNQAGTLSGVTIGSGGTVVAIGTTASQQAFFMTADASGAHPVSLTDIPGGLVPEVKVAGTAMDGNQQVVVGSANGYPAIWHRTAGAPWALVSSLAQVSGNSGLASLSSVAHGPAGWLAVGASGPIALTSADGVTWHRSQAVTQDLAGTLNASVAAGPGGYVIVGSKAKPTSGCLPVVWWSPNLTTWTKGHDVNVTDGSSVVLTVAADGKGFVSGGAHDGGPAVWTTTDGRAWTTVLLPVTAGYHAGQINDVAVSGHRIVALGQETSKAGIVSPLAELSTNGGLSWRVVPFGSVEPGTTVTALTSGKGHFTAASQFGILGQQDAAIWTSADGTTWTRSSVNGLSGGGSHDIAALAPAGSNVTGIDVVRAIAGQKFVTIPVG